VPEANALLRAMASLKSGLSVPSMPSDLPLSKRLTHSTPPATNTSPSPALMACAAMRMVWSDELQ
jgi:hypothetical protein